MLETLQIGDFLFVNKFLYGAQTPERIRLGKFTLMSGLPVLKFPAIREPRQGDIIVFEFPQDRNQDYIKRCVAAAGDTVALTVTVDNAGPGDAPGFTVGVDLPAELVLLSHTADTGSFDADTGVWTSSATLAAFSPMSDVSSFSAAM